MQSSDIDSALTQFYRQYLQQVSEPCFPTAKNLLSPYVQDQIYRYMFDLSLFDVPPVRYRKRILKTITERIESAIEDPDEDEISDALMNSMAQLCLEASLPPAEAAMQKSTISYFPPVEDSAPILISEFPQLLAAGSNVGFRTWDTCLRLAYFLCTEGQVLIKNKTIIELGAGTGMLSILCANHLGADSVLATDGNTEVVASMTENISLNSDKDSNSDTIKAVHFDWTDSDTLTEALGLSSIKELPKYDLILGADIIYNPEYFEPLVSTLELLLAVNEYSTILIASVVRNINTYNTFLETCAQNKLEVLEVEYQCPPLHQQKGFFHAVALPIKIMHIRRKIATNGGLQKAKLDSRLARFVMYES